MRPFPHTPSHETVDDDRFASGHLWLLELIDGVPLRVQLRESGLLRFGDGTRAFDGPDDVPLSLRHAVRHVRDRFDRESLRDAVDDVESVTVYGVATTRRSIDYDWDRLPPFLGVDVRDGDAVLPPDAVDAIVDRLGLEPVTVVDREVRARDFDPDVDAFPRSAWYDGPVAGLLVKNKRGGRAAVEHPDIGDPDPSGDPDLASDADPSNDHAATDVADAFATDHRLERLARSLESRNRPVDYDTLRDRTLEAIAREAVPTHSDGARDGVIDAAVDVDTLRTAVGERTQAFLANREHWD
ncbi:hypothetical protein [Halovivax cerinus]|uniref:RNA ligase domain-containing protein n=1 Tax=Halovivax cerinus TaxID=1487865 RepID=A0ABD5NSA0_9EURY|nr:hypothetical protein [Halovivax cerinus]